MAAIRFLFRERLYIESETIETRIKDYYFDISQKAASDYRCVVEDNITKQGILEPIHPLYLTKISWHIVENLNDFLEQPIQPKLLKMLVHLSNHFEYLSDFEYDKDWQVKCRLSLIEPHKKGTRLTIRFEYYQEDNLVAIEHTTGLLYGVKCLGKSRQFAQLPTRSRVVENLIWSKKIPIHKDLPYVYAEKAGIDAPIHTDPEFAKSIGLPDIILQGTYTFAKAVSLIINEYLQTLEGLKRKPIKSLSVNFTGMLSTPNEIMVRVLFQSEERIVFDVLDNKGKAVIKGGNIIFSL